MMCDKWVCIFTISGLLVAIAYHAVAYEKLARYCYENEVDECKQKVIEDRYTDIGVFYWDIAIWILNIPSVIFYILGQSYQDKWFIMFKKRDRHRSTKVSGFKSRDRYMYFIIRLIILCISPIPGM
jgi:hypothetical protein